MCFYPKQTDADEAMQGVNPIMRLWNGQKFCSTLMQSHTLWTSCLFGSPSDDWLWCISTLLTAGNFSSGTCLPMTNIQLGHGNMWSAHCVHTKQHSFPQKSTQAPVFGWNGTEGAPWPLQAIWDNTFLDPLFPDCPGQGQDGKDPTSTISDVTVILWS